jgi:hypothetical protein
VSRRLIFAVVALGLLAAGCGERQVSPPLPPVHLVVDHPADASTVDDDSVEVSGRVTPPDARVLVDGEEVRPATGGDFKTDVTLEEGVNVIDIEAGADRHPAAMAALRVTRRVRVVIPSDLADGTLDDVLQRLSDLGLETSTADASTLLDVFVPGDAGVCFTDPDGGTSVLAGSHVTVYVAPHCG